MTKTIYIADDFSTTPAGRYKSDGQFSGEKFRDDILMPALKTHDIVIVNLDNTIGYGSSFLEEAFGGIIRSGTFTHKELKKKLKIKSSRSFYINRVWSYIEAAKK
ncbi:STAS-like domain-containing protein [Acidithiobacillus ferriphilus]|uniref:STAS-like domain-containing protein n=1 Tax=Acidithiobacillus ferriphilus TaxID=1689834 RepID=UPI001C06D17C|nr:STAS-like domain-containing protein [Acidithiobacillus ferriphilus]MBU2848594.1 STAS-like domain-containing protein [Acidithiobacillus ferriphilus]